MNLFNQALDDVMALDETSRELLLEVVKKRMIDKERADLAQAITDSRAELKSGKLKAKSAKQIIDKLKG
jgi:hypothetical protein